MNPGLWRCNDVGVISCSTLGHLVTIEHRLKTTVYFLLASCTEKSGWWAYVCFRELCRKSGQVNNLNEVPCCTDQLQSKVFFYFTLLNIWLTCSPCICSDAGWSDWWASPAAHQSSAWLSDWCTVAIHTEHLCQCEREEGMRKILASSPKLRSGDRGLLLTA